MKKQWTKEETEKLVKYINKGLSKSEISIKLGRTIPSVEKKAKALGMRFQGKRTHWSKKEVSLLKEIWKEPGYNKEQIERIFKRTYRAVRQKAIKLDLGRREKLLHLSPRVISEEMNIPLSRVYSWIKDFGLNAIITETQDKYEIKENELLLFLKRNPDKYNASVISYYLFSEEPVWLFKKRKSDYLLQRRNSRKPWSNNEDRQLVELYVGLKLDVCDISKIMNRSESSIKTRASVLNLHRRKRKRLKKI